MDEIKEAQALTWVITNCQFGSNKTEMNKYDIITIQEMELKLTGKRP
jgi:hypothetical protein